MSCQGCCLIHFPLDLHDFQPTHPKCGVKICWFCGEHEGLDRCFCGWSRNGGNGYQELIKMGEQIEEV